MDGSFIGSGTAYIISNKCKKLIPFTSSYSYIFSEEGSIENRNFSTITYKNSLIGTRTLSAVYGPKYDDNAVYQELASDGLLNFVNIFFFDAQLNNFIVIITITGRYKKCNYSSIDLQYRLPSKSSSVNAINDLKKKSRSSEELHKILDQNESLKKKYLEICAKLGK